MRKILPVLAFTALLGGCGLLTSEMTLTERVTAVRDKAVFLCGYLPTPESVTHMLLAANPVSQGVEAVANAICSAVIAWQNSQMTGSAFASNCPKVNGVCVEGSFIKPKKGD